jgi:hypothetical protein
LNPNVLAHGRPVTSDVATAYAFPLMVLLWTPLGLFAMLAVAARAALPSGNERQRAMALLLLPAATIRASSAFVDAQLGIRCVLPALQFLFVCAGRAALRRRRG